MTRWTMVADLRRCVGCQTCTVACKHANATPPAVQWRRVLDIESGEFPDVRRTFVPVGCMHCEDPPCKHVCPSTATGQRADGIVTIDYDLCIGCAYCAVACPYQARYKVDHPRFAYGNEGRMKSESVREDPARIGVAQKCTFCADRIDPGLAAGLTPGVDADATPACVNSCIADALHFGDADDAQSNVSQLLAENSTFTMHAELETAPNFHYVWAAGGEENVGEEAPAPSTGIGGVGAAAPWIQQHWDWRAAGNFMGGGAGGGLMAFAALAQLLGTSAVPWTLPTLALVGAGLFLVFLETGRPFRAPLNVFFHPQTSWMTREAMTGAALFAIGIAAVLLGSGAAAFAAGALGLLYLYCQARILTEAKGIPAWREPAVTPLMIATGLTEGVAVYALLAPTIGAAAPPAIVAGALLAALAARAWTWRRYLGALDCAPRPPAHAVLERFGGGFLFVGVLIQALLAAGALVRPEAGFLVPAAALPALLAGWWFKVVLITRASYNQGFALVRTPERGGAAGPGATPGWDLGS